MAYVLGFLGMTLVVGIWAVWSLFTDYSPLGRPDVAD
jgi:hypothetical protein